MCKGHEVSFNLGRHGLGHHPERDPAIKFCHVPSGDIAKFNGRRSPRQCLFVFFVMDITSATPRMGLS